MRYEGPTPSFSCSKEDHWERIVSCGSSYIRRIETARRWLAWSIAALVSGYATDEERAQFSKEAQWEAEFIETYEGYEVKRER